MFLIASDVIIFVPFSYSHLKLRILHYVASHFIITLWTVCLFSLCIFPLLYSSRESLNRKYWFNKNGGDDNHYNNTNISLHFRLHYMHMYNCMYIYNAYHICKHLFNWITNNCMIMILKNALNRSSSSSSFSVLSTYISILVWQWWYLWHQLCWQDTLNLANNGEIFCFVSFSC